MTFEEQKACRNAPRLGTTDLTTEPGNATVAPAGTYWLEAARVAFNLRYHQEHDDAE